MDAKDMVVGRKYRRLGGDGCDECFPAGTIATLLRKVHSNVEFEGFDGPYDASCFEPVEICPDCGGVLTETFHCSTCKVTWNPDYLHVEDTKSTATIDDPINHPKHYTSKNGVECIQVTEQFNFNKGNAIKYIWRSGEKDSKKEVEDLEKARWYLAREIERLKTK